MEFVRAIDQRQTASAQAQLPKLERINMVIVLAVVIVNVLLRIFSTSPGCASNRTPGGGRPAAKFTADHNSSLPVYNNAGFQGHQQKMRKIAGSESMVNS